MTPTRASIERLNLGLGVGTATGAAVLGSPAFALAVALGTALEVVNFRALHHASLALFAGQVATGGRWVVVFGLRFLLLGIAIGAALGAGAHPIGLVLGLSMVIPAALIAAWRSRPPILAQTPLLPLPPDDPSWDDYSVWSPMRQGASEAEDR